MSVNISITLRPCIDADLPSFYQHQCDAKACEMAAFPSRELDAFMTHWRQNVLPNPQGLARSILLDGRVVGNIVSWRQKVEPSAELNPDLDSLSEPLFEQELGYWIDPQHWGKGIASAALANFLCEVSIRPIFAHVASHNIGSQRVLSKSGFTKRHEYPFEALEATRYPQSCMYVYGLG